MFKDFIVGISSYFKAYSFVNKHQLHRYFLISGLLSLLIGSAIFFAAYTLSDDLGNSIYQFYPFEKGGSFVSKVLNIFAGSLIAILGIILYKYILLICISPFMGPLSAKVEEILTNRINESKFSIKQVSYEIIRGFRIAMRNLFRELIYTLILLLIGLIPLFTIFITPALFLIQSYFVGFSSLDYYLERRANIRQSIHFVKNNKGLAIGNGMGFLLLLIIPVIGLFMAPVLSTVAATISIIERSKDI